MPVFPIGKPLTIYLAGYNFSSSTNEYQTDPKVEALDNTCFSPSFHKTNQPGDIDSDITLKGYYNHTTPPDVTGFVNQLKAAMRVDTVGLVVMPQATTPAVGDLADLFIAAALDRDVSVAVDKIVTVDAKFKTKSGLHIGNAMIAEGAASFPTTGYDHGGASWVNDSTLYNYIVVLQVLAYTSGFAAITVQTSPDNSAWTTRGTFAAITAIGGYSLTLNAILHRYIRINGTGVGTIIAGFARIY